jgi:hypothetical protein
MHYLPHAPECVKERFMADAAAGVLIDTIHDWGVDVVPRR